MALWASKSIFGALEGCRRFLRGWRTNLDCWTPGGRLEGADGENGGSLGLSVLAQSDEDVEASSETFRRRPALPVESEGREAAR